MAFTERRAEGQGWVLGCLAGLAKWVLHVCQGRGGAQVRTCSSQA